METIAFTSLILLLTLSAILVIQLGLIAKRFGRLVSKLEEDLPPLLEKADSVLDSAQGQLTQVEEVVQSVHVVSMRLQQAAGTAQQVLSSPLAGLLTFAAGAGKSWRTKIGRRGLED